MTIAVTILALIAIIGIITGIILLGVSPNSKPKGINSKTMTVTGITLICGSQILCIIGLMLIGVI